MKTLHKNVIISLFCLISVTLIAISYGYILGGITAGLFVIILIVIVSIGSNNENSSHEVENFLLSLNKEKASSSEVTN